VGALLEVFQLYPWTALAAALVLGLLVGSFLNVVVYRLPQMLEADWRAQCCELLEQPQPEPETFNLIKPRSRCPHCGHGIRAWENIPVLSYLFLRGRCSACRAPIAGRYPLVELATGLLSLVVGHHFGDNITLPLLWLGLVVNSQGLFVPLEAALWGAVAGYLSLWSIYWLFKLITGKEGMGYGDFKLLAALGAWLGWQLLPVVILLSSLVGAVIGIGLMLALGRDRNIPIPFGPYLAMAGWLALIWGDQLMHQYLQIAL